MKICDRCHTTYPTEFSTCPKDQSVLCAVADMAPGMVLRGKYEIVERVGAGGMAVVYRVRHLHLQEDVALKVVNSWVAADPQFLERFKTEAVITRRLRHPNAVRIDDFDVTDDGRPFIVMEYVRGRSLREVMRSKGLIPPAEAAAILRQVLLALGAAHELGIVHRDIKPENILLVGQPDGSEMVKVLDFGIAKITKDSFDSGEGYTPTQTGIVLGTPQYVSPEQARGKRGQAPVDGRADLYSLGVVLYEMLTGQLPFVADSPFDLLLQHLETPPTPPHLANAAAGIPAPMSDVVMKALAKDPAQRFQTAGEMAAALANPEALLSPHSSAQIFSTAALAAAAAAMEGQQPAQDDPPRGAVAATIPMAAQPPRTVAVAAALPKPSPRRRKRWTYAALGGAAVVAILWLGLAFRRSEPAPEPAVVMANPPAVERTTPAKPRRAPAPRRAPSSAGRTAPTVDQPREPLDHVKAQELVAVGYRRMQQRDFDGARDAFQEALDIEPGNPAAEKGMRAAQTAQTVQGLAGVFRN